MGRALAHRHRATTAQMPSTSSASTRRLPRPNAGDRADELMARSLQHSVLEWTRLGEERVEKCDVLVDLGRRRFLRGASISAAGAAAATMLPLAAEAAPT